jgi:hypothetical protein
LPFLASSVHCPNPVPYHKNYGRIFLESFTPAN